MTMSTRNRSEGEPHGGLPLVPVVLVGLIVLVAAFFVLDVMRGAQAPAQQPSHRMEAKAEKSPDPDASHSAPAQPAAPKQAPQKGPPPGGVFTM